MSMEELLKASIEKWRQIEDIVASTPDLPCPLCIAVDERIIAKCPLNKSCNYKSFFFNCCLEWTQVSRAVKKMKDKLQAELKKIEKKGEK